MNRFQLQSPSMTRLQVISGNTTTSTVSVPLPCLLGRGQEADLCISHLTVSRNHCRLDLKDGKIYLTDLDSRNGTMVNDEFIPANTPVELDSNKTFSVGPITFVCDYQPMDAPHSESRFKNNSKPVVSTT